MTPVSDIQSDRICGIRIKRTTGDSKSWISILGVYLPCLDQGMELYCDSLVELERMVVESGQWGPVIITGDFNAHLGPTWGSRAHKNIQGVLLGEVLDRCKLHAVSLGEAAFLALTTPIIQGILQPLWTTFWPTLRPLPVLSPVKCLRTLTLTCQTILQYL